MLDRLRDGEMLDLRIGKDLIDCIDRPARYARAIEQIDPIRAVPLRRIVLDRGVERVSVRRACRLVRVARVLQEFRRAEGAAQPAEMRVTRSGDIDVPVAGSENTGWNACRMIVSGLWRDLAGDQPAHGLKIQHGDLTLKQRGLHPLPFA